MKEKPFSVILDTQTRRKLERLARVTERSKGAIVRLLIRAAPDDFAVSVAKLPEQLVELLREQ